MINLFKENKNKEVEEKELVITPIPKQPKYGLEEEIVFTKCSNTEKKFLFEGRILKHLEGNAYLVYVGDSEAWVVCEGQILSRKNELKVDTLNSLTQEALLDDGANIKIGDTILAKSEYQLIIAGEAYEDRQRLVGTVIRIKRSPITQELRFLISFVDGSLREIKEKEIERCL